MQEDVRFVSGTDFRPLNKLRHMHACDVVHVLFTDPFKTQLVAAMSKVPTRAINSGITARSQISSDFRCAEMKDPAFLQLVEQLMHGVVHEMVRNHRTNPPELLTIPGSRMI